MMERRCGAGKRRENGRKNARGRGLQGWGEVMQGQGVLRAGCTQGRVLGQDGGAEIAR